MHCYCFFSATSGGDTSGCAHKSQVRMEPKLVFVLITLSTVVHSQNSVFKFDLRDVLRKYSTDDIVGKKGTAKLGSRPVQGGQENPSTSCGYEVTIIYMLIIA